MSESIPFSEQSFFPHGSCSNCGGRLFSNEWDGECYSCAHHKKPEKRKGPNPYVLALDEIGQRVREHSDLD